MATDEPFATIAARWAEAHSLSLGLREQYSRWYAVPVYREQGRGGGSCVHARVDFDPPLVQITVFRHWYSGVWRRVGNGVENTEELEAMLSIRRCYDLWIAGGPPPPASTAAEPDEVVTP